MADDRRRAGVAIPPDGVPDRDDGRSARIGIRGKEIAAKIADLRSPAYRLVLSAMARNHVAPCAYIWGFADTIRAGLEGRADPVFAFGHSCFNACSTYFFPGVLALRLPIGSMVLVLLGLWLYCARRLPAGWRAPQSTVLVATIFFLLVLMRGVPYGGIRHALPIVVLLSVFAGTAAQYAMASHSTRNRIFVAIAFGAAALSAVPVMRPWEHFNEILGGSSQAYHYFNDGAARASCGGDARALAASATDVSLTRSAQEIDSGFFRLFTHWAGFIESASSALRCASKRTCE